MVQGIFDDLTWYSDNFNYPDTQKWDAIENTDEFVTAMERGTIMGLFGIFVKFYRAVARLDMES